MSIGWRNGWSCEVHQNASVGYVGLGSCCPLCKAENENMSLKLKLKQAEALLERAWWAGHNEGYRTTFEEWKAQQEGGDE